MGVMNYLFDGDLMQRADIERTKVALYRQAHSEKVARRKLREGIEGVVERLQEAENDVGELTLFVRTLFRLLLEKGTVGRDEFLQAARAIDAQDGTVDGKYTGSVNDP